MRIWLPEWLYHGWPWLVLGGAIGCCETVLSLVACALAAYAAWVIGMRYWR